MMGSMMRRGSFGDGATLSLDFTTGTLDPLLTFTRSSSGTYLGADGLVKTAGTNVARFDYDTSGTPLGLLIEASATNLLAHTERLDEAQVSTEQYWITTYSLTGATAATPGPDGVSNSATQFAPIAGNGTCIASAAMGTSAQRSFSFYAKQSSGTTNLEYTLNNGTTWVAVTTTSSWQRFTIAATTAAQRVGFRFAANNVYEIWGCQLEAGSGSSSYIKNVSAAGGATRSADFCDCSSTSFSSWFTQGPGTILVHARRFRQGFSDFASVCTSSGDPRIAVRANGLAVQIYGNSAGTIANVTTANTYSLNTNFKTAAVFKQNDYAVVLNGGTVATYTTAGGYPTALNRLTIGQEAEGAGFMLNGWISLLKYWPVRLSNSQIQEMTT